MSDTREMTCPKHGPYTALRQPFQSGGWDDCRKCRQDLEHVGQWSASSGIGPRFRAASFDGFDVATDAQRLAVAHCRAFATTFDPTAGGGLLLLGRPGTGKTMLGSAIVRHAIHERIIEARIVTARALIRRLRDTWHRDAKVTESSVISDLGSIGLLVIDDIGATGSTESEAVQMLDVIDARYRNGRPTVVTSNLNAPMLKAAIGDRAFDRLRDGARVVVFDWQSHRTEAE